MSAAAADAFTLVNEHVSRKIDGGPESALSPGFVSAIGEKRRQSLRLPVPACERWKWMTRREDRSEPTDDDRHAAALNVVRVLQEAGHEALFAGGCVRDLELGLRPGDYDIATSARPDDVCELFPRTVPIGAKFGVILVVTAAGSFEVATFRSDGDYHDHRRPSQVTYSDARGDAERRDFTINGMFCDPLTGEVHDFVGGRADLAARRIRAIGDPRARFDEDRLRLLRCVRFAARLDAEIEEETWAALCEMAAGITEIAGERIGEEIRKMLLEEEGGRVVRALDLLAESGLLEAVLPEVAVMRGVEQSPEHHPEGDVFVHTRLLLAQFEAGHEEALRFAALLHDIAKPVCAERSNDGRIRFHGHCERGEEMVHEIFRRLRFSNALRDKVSWLVRHHLRHLDARRMRVATLRRFLAEEHFPDLLELIRLDALAGSGDLEDWQFLRTKLDDFSREELKPAPLLRGRDLLDVGYQPGPSMKSVLNAAYDAQLEGRIADIEEARRWVLANHPPESKSDA